MFPVLIFLQRRLTNEDLKMAGGTFSLTEASLHYLTYLHGGGVAVGANSKTQLGMEGT